MPEKFLTTEDVAWMLNLNMKVVQRKMRNGEIPAIKMGGEWRGSESEIVRWMNAKKQDQGRDTDYVF